MSLPIARIIWYKTDPDAHGNHLHVEGDPRYHQWELPTNGIWTPAIGAIFDALSERYGEGEHFIIDPDAPWTHMGVYNPRYISGTSIWSQHAGANAIDIGPYYDEEQQEFYDFLTGKEEDMFNSHEVEELKRLVAALDEVDSNGGFAKFAVQNVREHRSGGRFAHPHGGTSDGVSQQEFDEHTHRTSPPS